MDNIKEALDTAGMLASMAWAALSFISNGHPASALALAVIGGGWLSGVWMILGSFS